MPIESPTITGGGRDNAQTVDGAFVVTANQVTFLSRPPMPPLTPDPSVITLLASGLTQLPQLKR